MNKLKNIGISALAGTLVSLSAAQAGGVSVSGTYELTYTQLDHTAVTGNPLGVKKNIAFGAGGDISDGGGVTWASNIGWTDGADLSSASIAINMGGIATLTYDSGGGGTGANAVDNITPTAWEEVDYGFSTGISDVGAVSASKGVINLTVKAPVSGTGISLSYASGMSGGHVGDGAVGGADGNQGIDLVIDVVNYNAAHAGFRLGVAAQVELPEETCERSRNKREVITDLASCSSGHKHEPYAGSMYTKLQLGPLHFGTQATFKNNADASPTGIANQRSIMGGIAAVFGDTLSLSYGVAYDKFRYNDRNRGFTASPARGSKTGYECASAGHCGGPEEFEYSTTKFRGLSAALNLGPVALKGTRNHANTGNAIGMYKFDTTHTELNLSIAF